MKKLAIFVEGQTERIFCETFLLELARNKQIENDINIISKKASGGRRFKRYLRTIKGTLNNNPNLKFYVLIIDCGSDNRVISEIIDQCPTLEEAGYQKIIGMRDLHPILPSKLKKLHKGVVQSLGHISIEFDIVIPVMETEAWFLAEYSHLERISQNLTAVRVLDELNIDLVDGDVEELQGPSSVLNDIYFLDGLEYKKSETEVTRTVDALDVNKMRIELTNSLQSLNTLTKTLDAFLV